MNEVLGVEVKRGSVSRGSALIWKNEVESEAAGEVEGRAMVEDADVCFALSTLVTGNISSTET